MKLFVVSVFGVVVLSGCASLIDRINQPIKSKGYTITEMGCTIIPEDSRFVCGLSGTFPKENANMIRTLQGLCLISGVEPGACLIEQR
jgi:uncharacterized protein YceK